MFILNHAKNKTMRYFSKIKIGLVLFITCLFLLNKKSCAQCKEGLDTIPVTFVVTLKSEGHTKTHLLNGFQVMATLSNCAVIDVQKWLNINKKVLNTKSLFVHYIFRYRTIL